MSPKLWFASFWALLHKITANHLASGAIALINSLVPGLVAFAVLHGYASQKGVLLAVPAVVCVVIALLLFFTDEPRQDEVRLVISGLAFLLSMGGAVLFGLSAFLADTAVYAGFCTLFMLLYGVSTFSAVYIHAKEQDKH